MPDAMIFYSRESSPGIRKGHQVDHIVVRVIETHVDSAPGSFGRPFDDPGSKTRHRFIRFPDILNRKRQADILVLIVLLCPVVIDRQRGSFRKNNLMRFIAAVVVCAKKLLIERRKSRDIVCQKTHFT